MNALITGASNGIGMELAEQFAKNNINVLLVARDQQGLTRVAERLIKTYGIQAKAISIDLSTPSASDELYKQTKEIGWDIDYLVNDAGFGDFGFFIETDWRKDVSMIDLNITTLTHLCRLFIPDMVARKNGKVLNLASTAAFQPGPLMAIYYATKAYVLSFSQAINNELKGTGVTVTALCPGPTSTGFSKVAHAEKTKLFNKKLPSAYDVARYGYISMMTGKSVAVHGFSNKILTVAVRLLPRDIITTLVRGMSE